MSETLRFDGDLSSVSRFVMLRRTGRRFYAKLGGQSSQVGPATARVLAGFRCEGTGPSTHQVRKTGCLQANSVSEKTDVGTDVSSDWSCRFASRSLRYRL